MTNNISKHISDAASSVTFDPAGTDWPADVTDVQTAIGKIGSWATLDPTKHEATESVRGIAKLASIEMVMNGTDDETIVTPAGLYRRLTSPMASESEIGWARNAIDDESLSERNQYASASPRNIHYIFDNRECSEDSEGAIQVATNDEAVAGTDHTKVMTPLKVKKILESYTPVAGEATETEIGFVTLASVDQLLAGTLRDGYAISPYTFRRVMDRIFKRVITTFTGNSRDLKPGWTLCNGESVNGIRVPNLRNRFMRGGTFNDSGIVGGENTYDISKGITVADAYLSSSHLPSHSHTRGDMDITGSFGVSSGSRRYISGAFYDAGTRINDTVTGGGSGRLVTFDASKGWSGTFGYSGGGKPHKHGISGSILDIRPAYYTLAYIMYVGIT